MFSRFSFSDALYMLCLELQYYFSLFW